MVIAGKKEMEAILSPSACATAGSSKISGFRILRAG
jgi:hypothetical protein